MGAAPGSGPRDRLCSGGKKDEARKIIDELKEQSKREYVPAISFAWIYIGLSEKEHSLEWLEKAYEEHDRALDIKGGPWFDPLRSAPLQSLLRSMNFPE